MPIVSDHPHSVQVIKRVEEQCGSDLQAFVEEYAQRRKAYRDRAGKSALIDKLEDDHRGEFTLRQLLDLLEAREAAAQELHDELNTMNRELTLLKRELRGARRRLLESSAGVNDEVESYTAAGVPEMMSMQDVVRRARDRQSWAWLGPWLRGFLPNSA